MLTENPPSRASFAPTGLALRARNEVQAHRVDAVTQAGRWRAVREYMPQVRIAGGADYFGANHAVADIADLDHRTVANRRVEARPATAGIKLGFRIEQRLVAADAVVNAVSLGAVVLAGERSFGAFEATNVVLLRIEHGLPFFQGFFQLFHRHTSAAEKARSVPFPRIGRHV